MLHRRNWPLIIAHRGASAAAPETLAEGLRQFKGIKRRLETVGVAKGVTVLDDFAHHPTAVHETLSALRTGYPGRRVWAVFEPRSASSCRRVFQADFARAFGAADEVVLAAVFRSSLPESERLSAEQLVEDLSREGRHARHIPEIDDIVSTTYLSVTCPVLVAPAMNVRMWEHVAVRENVALLRKRGVRVIEPDEGILACGDYGKGRLAATETILAAVREML